MRNPWQFWIGLGLLAGLAVWWFSGHLDAMTQGKAKPTGEKVRVRLLTEGGEVGPVLEVPKVVRSDKEWAARLSLEQFRIGRTAGTERAFCGVFHDNHKKGIYFCAGCGLPLFRSGDKFDSGTGWPSFFQPFAEENIGEQTDNELGMTRTEVHCVRCDMHLGHVFPDGPKPSGLRYCINSAVLGFQEEGVAPELETIDLAGGLFLGRGGGVFEICRDVSNRGGIRRGLEQESDLPGGVRAWDGACGGDATGLRNEENQHAKSGGIFFQDSRSHNAKSSGPGCGGSVSVGALFQPTGAGNGDPQCDRGVDAAEKVLKTDRYPGGSGGTIHPCGGVSPKVFPKTWRCWLPRSAVRNCPNSGNFLVL